MFWLDFTDDAVEAVRQYSAVQMTPVLDRPQKLGAEAAPGRAS